jgi:hypothetical protein
MNFDDKLNVIISFCEEINAKFTIGEIGLCGACVGITKDGSYVSYNPIQTDDTLKIFKTGENLAYIQKLYDEDFEKILPYYAYGKHNSIAVLVQYDEEIKNKRYSTAVNELYKWVVSLKKIGVQTVHYESKKFLGEEWKTWSITKKK